MDVVIRQASESDVASILRVVAQLDGLEADRLTIEEGTRILGKMTGYPDYGVYVAEDADSRVVGTFAIMVMDNLAHGGAPSAILEDVCVDLSSRGQGGRAMMEFAMKHAKNSGCYKLALSSNSARTGAHDFYRSLGFAQHGVSFCVGLEEDEAAQPRVAADRGVPGR